MGSTVTALMVLVRAFVANAIMFPEVSNPDKLLSFVVQKDEHETRCWDADGTDVGSHAAGNVRDTLFILETAVKLEVCTKGLASPGKIALSGDVFRQEVLDFDGGWRSSGLPGPTTTNGYGNPQFVQAGTELSAYDWN